jgi:drug/metabolite transporter (DMT)-like permease
MGVAEWQAPGVLEAAQMAANGLLVGCATVALAAAFRYADAARLAPFGYSGLVWGLGFDLAIWGRMPGLAMLAGAALVVTACIMSERAAR